MLYLIELHRPMCAPLFVFEHADTSDDARAVPDARLGRDDDYSDVVIAAVYPIQ
jgi:hypothetical protein